MAEALRRSVQSGIWLAVLAALAAGGCSKTVSNNSKAAGQEQAAAKQLMNKGDYTDLRIAVALAMS